MSALPIFDVDEIVVVTKDGIHKNMPVLIKNLTSYNTPYNKDIFYDCETTDEPPKIIVVNEKDLISFDQYLEDVDLDMDFDDEDFDLAIFNGIEDMMLELDFNQNKKCECGAEKTKIGNHSTWCPKYEE